MWKKVIIVRNISDSLKYNLDNVSVRLVKDAPLIGGEPLNNPESVVKKFAEMLREFDREVLAMINLNAKNVPINVNIISIGGVNYSVAEPREIFKSAILSNASNMILLHNHPSGSLEPSKEDVITTDRLKKACDIIGITLLDHIIVSSSLDDKFFSFKEKGVISSDKLKYEQDFNKVDLGAVAESGSIMTRDEYLEKLLNDYSSGKVSAEAYDQALLNIDNFVGERHSDWHKLTADQKMLRQYHRDGESVKYLINYIFSCDDKNTEEDVLREMVALGYKEKEIVECLEYDFAIDMDWYHEEKETELRNLASDIDEFGYDFCAYNYLDELVGDRDNSVDKIYKALKEGTVLPLIEGIESFIEDSEDKSWVDRGNALIERIKKVSEDNLPKHDNKKKKVI